MHKKFKSGNDATLHITEGVEGIPYRLSFSASWKENFDYNNSQVTTLEGIEEFAKQMLEFVEEERRLRQPVKTVTLYYNVWYNKETGNVWKSMTSWSTRKYAESVAEWNGVMKVGVIEVKVPAESV